MTKTTEEVALDLGVRIHRYWEHPQEVASLFRQAKIYALYNNLNYDIFIKRVGDFMRECFDREPKTRLPQVEDMIRARQMEINYWQQEM